MYMKKFLHFDWLRSVQFFLKQRRKELIQCKKRKQTKHSDWSMIKKLPDGQSNLLLSNQAHALDGVIDGAIFPDCVIRLRSFCSTISKFFIYIINKYSHDFSCAIWNKQALVNFSKTPNCTRPTGSCNFVSL